MTFLVLAAITFQGVFGSLQGSVVICLGGGHEHEIPEVFETETTCASGCTHHHAHPHPHPHPHLHQALAPVEHEHEHDHESGCCQCTDIEIGLLALQTNTRFDSLTICIPVDQNPQSIVEHVLTPRRHALRAPPPSMAEDPGNASRLAVIRSTRLLV